MAGKEHRHLCWRRRRLRKSCNTQIPTGTAHVEYWMALNSLFLTVSLMSMISNGFAQRTSLYTPGEVGGMLSSPIVVVFSTV